MSAPRSEARLNWLVLVLAVLASFWLGARAKRAERPARHPASLLDAVPPGPSLLLTVDVQAMGEAAAVEILRAGGGALLGLRELCGFEPLLGLRRVALALPVAESGETPDFAVIAQSALDPEPVLRCAEAVIRKRGGTPVRSALGEFRSVRDQKKPLGEIAIRTDGLFVLSGGRYFRDVIDAASGRFVPDAAALARARRHTEIRRHLEPAALVLSLLDGPLALPGVRSLGASLTVGQALGLRGYVGCESTTECEEARGLVERMRAALLNEPGFAFLRDLRLELHSSEIELSALLPREQLGPLVTQLLGP